MGHEGLFTSVLDPNPSGVGRGGAEGADGVSEHVSGFGGAFLNSLFHSEHIRSTHKSGGQNLLYYSGGKSVPQRCIRRGGGLKVGGGGSAGTRLLPGYPYGPHRRRGRKR